MPVLEVKRLKKSFGQTAVLKGIDFSIEQGQALSIIGPSGSGKTTLLRCLNFLELADGGTISVNGAVIYRGGDSKKHSDAEIRKKRLHFGLVFQNFNLFPQYTALKNVTLAGEMLARERPDYRAHKNEILAEIEENARALLDQVGLSDKLDFYPHQLSGGQQQRVAIARALALKPDILCFDEPTSALDPELTGEVLKVIRSLAEKNTTMVIVTHEMQFARDVSDIVLFIDGGVVVESGPPEQIFDNPRAMRTRQFLERYNGT
jgi:polar amino acid transport system ATP-binding protein